MANLSYSPTFHHVTWVDKIDRVEAEGPNGMNVRFGAIEEDLRQASTVVSQIGTAIDGITRTQRPLPPQNRVALTPVGFFFTDDSGLPSAEVNEGNQGGGGTANVLVPDRVQLTRLNVVANLSNQLDLGVATLTVSLMRMPLRLTNPPPQPTVLAQVFSSDDGHQVLHGDVTQQSLGAVDLSTFRYLISVDWSGLVLVSHFVTIVSVQLEYTT